MTLDLRWLTIIGLAFDIVGVALVAWPLLVSQEKVFRTEGAVLTRLKESTCARIGVAVLMLGFMLQIVGNWPL